MTSLGLSGDGANNNDSDCIPSYYAGNAVAQGAIETIQSQNSSSRKTTSSKSGCNGDNPASKQISRDFFGDMVNQFVDETLEQVQYAYNSFTQTTAPNTKNYQVDSGTSQNLRNTCFPESETPKPTNCHFWSSNHGYKGGGISTYGDMGRIRPHNLSNMIDNSECETTRFILTTLSYG